MDQLSALEHITHRLEQDVLYANCSEMEKVVLDFWQAYSGMKRPKSFRLGRRKQCFQNAISAVLDRNDERLSYVEGYAKVPGLPAFPHAWIAFDDERAIELTVKSDPLEMAFFGVRFSRAELIRLMRDQETYGLLQLPIHPTVLELIRGRIDTKKHAVDAI